MRVSPRDFVAEALDNLEAKVRPARGRRHWREAMSGSLQRAYLEWRCFISRLVIKICERKKRYAQGYARVARVSFFQPWS